MIRACPSCGARNRIPARHLSDRGRCGSCKNALPPVDAPLEVDSAGFDEVVREAKVPVLVDFWAEWCGPCRMAAPHVERVAKEMGGRAVVLKVNTEENPQLSARYGIRSIPNFMIFRAGRPVRQQAGLVDSRRMGGWLQEAGAV